MFRARPVGRLALLALALGLAAPGARAQHTWLPLDERGWSILKPAPDTRICYVSSSKGNDQTARPHPARDKLIGADPFSPKGAIRPYKTLAKALGATREGAPDWILLKRGDEWVGQPLGVRNGLGPEAPFVISAYGSGDQRPRIKHGPLVGMALGNKERHHLAIVGIEFHAHTRDPDGPDFVDAKGEKSGFSARSEGAFERILIEDCCFRFSMIALEQYGTGRSRDVAFRRNLFLDSYAPPKGAAQGLLVTGIPILLEENLFDHNGWNESPRVDSGAPTMYNQNIYITPVSEQTRRGTVLRGNLILRGSSIGSKFVGDAKFPLTNAILDDNFYCDGEIGASLGGNAEGPGRFRNIQVVNNVFTDMGRTNPLKRGSSWGMEVRDWDGGLIANNLFIHQDNPVMQSTLGIVLFRNLNNVIVRDNIFFGLKSVEPIFRIYEGASQSGVLITGNWIEAANRNVPLVEAPEKNEGIRFEGNRYVAAAQGADKIRVGKREVALKDWKAHKHETASPPKKSPFKDPNRTLATYHKTIGGEPSFEAFFAAARQQSKANWRPEYTAAAVNDYLRAGFGLQKIPSTPLPEVDPASPTPATNSTAAGTPASPGENPASSRSSTRSFRRGTTKAAPKRDQP